MDSTEKKITPTRNWRIRYADPNDKESFFFIEADLGKDGFYPRVEVMQEDFGDHNGYDRETRLADANLIIAAPKMLAALESLKGMEAWLGDEKIKKIFHKNVYDAINAAKGIQS